MRTFISLLLVTILTAALFSGCSADRREGGAAEDAQGTAPSGGPLVVYVPAYFNGSYSMYTAVSRRFTSIYGIDVELYPAPSAYDLRDENAMLNYKTEFAAEVMAGRGPDLFIASDHWGVFDDLMKKVSAGVFCDFNEFMEKDGDFDSGAYNETVMNAGLFKNSRYVMPLSYTVPMLITTEERMAEHGVAADDFSTYERFLSSWESLHASGKSLLCDGSGWTVAMRSGWLDECLDFERGVADLNLPSFQRIYALILEEDRLYEKDYLSDSGAGDAENEQYVDAFLKNGLFYFTDFGINGYETSFISPDTTDELNVILPIPNAYGAVTAVVEDYALISGASSNKEAAWNFVKILLNEEMQENWYDTTRSLGAPVRNDTTAAHIDAVNKIHHINFQPLEPALKEKARDHLLYLYASCDNAVIPESRGWLLFYKLIDLTYHSQDNSFETVKAKAENYFKIYLSE